jgi:1-deoxy-D-xylulose-5-phosphate reductoisomerase
VLAAGHKVDALIALCAATARPRRHRRRKALPGLRDGLRAAGLATAAHAGAAAIDALAAGPDCDTVVAAIVGAAGLSFDACRRARGKRLLLANKESLVLAGELLTAAAERRRRIIPIDSEHNAIFQCLRSRARPACAASC